MIEHCQREERSAAPRRSILLASFGLTFASMVGVIVAVLLTGTAADAATYSVTMSGATYDWATAPWTCTTAGPPGSLACGSVPGSGVAGDIANVGGFSGTLNVGSAIANAVTVNVSCSACALTVTSGSLPLTGASTVASGATFAINGGPVTLSAASDTLTINLGGTLKLNNGSVNGPGSLTVDGTMDWSAGYLGQTASLATTINGTLNIDPTAGTQNYAYLGNSTASTLTNNGTINYNPTAPYYLALNAGSTLNNAGTLALQNDQEIRVGGGTNTINNSGTISKTLTAGTNIIYPVVNNNDGTINNQSGVIDLRGGGSSTHSLNANNFQTGPGQKIDFAGGTFTIGGGTTFTGSGDFRLTNNATMTIPSGTVSIPIFDLVAGTVNGAGTLIVTSTLNWAQGSMSGTGITSVPSGATLNIDATAGPQYYVYLDSGRTLDTGGTVNYNPATPYYLALTNGSTINNSGTWNLQSDAQIGASGATNTINSTGTIQKTGGTGTSAIFPVVNNNDGTIGVLLGTLSLNGGGASSHTSNGANFSTALTGSTNIDFSTGATYTAGNGTTFTGAGTFRINGGTLSVPSGVVTIPALALISNGTLNGAGAVTVTGNMAWSYGNVTQGGTLTFPSGATLTLNPTYYCYLDGGRTLNINSGATLTYAPTSPYYLTLQNQSTINNSGTFTLSNDSPIWYGGTRPNTINNTSTIQKTGGTGVSILYPIVNNSDGTINAAVGAIGLYGGGTLGHTSNASNFITTTGTHIDFANSGAFSVAGATTFTGTGAYFIAGANMTFNGAVTMPNLTFSGGTITGAGTLTLTGTVSWTGGTMSGAGATIFDTGSTTNVSVASAYPVIDGRSVTNSGVLSYTGSTYYLQMANGAVFDNSGIFDLQNDVTIYASGTPTPAFNNLAAGTLRKTVATGASVFYPTLNNSGTVAINTGSVTFTGGGSSTGTFSAATGATLGFGCCGTQTITGGTMNGAGTFSFGGGTVVFTGTYAPTGTTSITGGTLTLDSNGSTTDFAESSGTLGGTGTLTINGSASWSGGTMTGGGATTFAASSTVTLTPNTGYLTVDNARTINNATTIVYGTPSPYYLQFGNGAVLNNSGIFDLQNDAAIYAYGTPTPAFNNLAAGTLRKTVATGASVFYPPLNNSGTVAINTGSVTFNGGGSSTGTFSAATGATLGFGCCGTQTITGGTMNGAGTFSFSGGTVVFTGTYAPTGTTSITGGTLTLDSNGSTTDFAESSGTLGGAGTLTINGNASWTGGTMTGGGATTFAASSTVTIAPNTGYLTVDNARTINNAATIVYGTPSPYYLQFGNGAVFNNSGIFDLQNDATIYAYGTPMPAFNNLAAGTLRKTVATGTSNFNPSLNNSGTVAINTGSVTFTGGGSSTGTFTAATGATLGFGCCGTQTITGGTMNGAGTLSFSGGTVVFTGTYAVTGTTSVTGGTFTLDSSGTTTNFALSSGTFNGAGTLTVSGSGNWTAGTMGGSGATTFPAGSTLSITPSAGYPTLDSRTLNNGGSLVYGTPATYYLQLANTALIENTGTFDIQNDQTIYAYGATPAIHNAAGATFTKSATASGSTNVVPVFNNDGTVTVAAGTLAFSGGGSSTGTFTPNSGATLQFACCGTYTMSTGGISGAGTVSISGGTVTVANTYSITGATTISNGTLTLNNAASTGTFALSGGTLAGTGAFTVNNSATITAGTMSGSGSTIFPAGSTVSIQPSAGYPTIDTRTITNAGSIVYGAPATYYLQLANGATVNNSGTFDLQNDQAIYVYGATLPVFNNNAGGTFRKSAAAGSTGFGPVFVNAGTVEAKSGTIAFGNGFTQTAGATILSTGTISSPTTFLFNAGTVGGAGTITGNVSNSGTLDPGTPTATGQINISGTYTQPAAGALTIDLNGVTPGSGYDQVVVSGAATLDGTLNINLFSGYMPPNGQVYTPISFASASGDFATKNGLTFSGGSFTYALNPTSVQISAGTCTSPPATITTPGLVCANSTNTASIAATTGATYTWSITNGTIVSGQGTPAITYSVGTASPATIGVTVVSGACSNTGSASVTVSSPPTATITASGPVTFCSGGSVTLTASTGASFLWSTGATTQSITVTTAGTYSVAVADAAGCSATSAPVTVSVTPSPSATITAPASVVPGSTGNVASVPAGPPGTTYAWSISGGTITAGASTSSITFSADTGAVTIKVVVSYNGCTASSSYTSGAKTSDMGVTINSTPPSVATGAAYTYSVLVSNAGPDDATSLVLNVKLDPAVGAGLTTGDFTCSNSSNILTCNAPSLAAGGTASLTVNATAPSTAGSFDAAAQIASANVDPIFGNNIATTVTVVTEASCPTAVPILVAPLDGAADLHNPVAFSWNSINGATGYEVWVGSGTTAPSLAAATTATSAGINLPSGTSTWYVVAKFANNCPPTFSEKRTVTVAAEAKCDHPAPELDSPADGETLPSPVTFTWKAVPEAIGYTLFLGIDGGAAQDAGSTDDGKTTSLALSLNGTKIVWYVVAKFTGCPTTQSAPFGFTIQKPDDCSNHGVATLLAPSGTSASSAVNFQWSAVKGASGYRVWAAIDGAPFAALGTTVGLNLPATIAKGSVEWFVESLFSGCPSTESAHSTFTIAAASSCNNAPASPSSPANGTTVHNQSIDFTWSAAPNAIGYEVYISLNNGTPSLIGSTTTATTLHHDVAAGNLEWFVRALFNGCDGVDSAHATFIFDPPPACPTQRPLLTSPSEAATGVTSPVNFIWTAVPGVTQYKLTYALNHGEPVTMTITNGDTHRDNVPIGNGAVEWFVEAVAPDCPSLISTTSSFTVVPPPPPCTTPDTTSIQGPANASDNVEYTVQWNPIPGVVSYELQESSSPSFAQATLFTVPNPQRTFQHTFAESSGAYFYRVRGVNECAAGAQRGFYSTTLTVVILPPQQTNAVHPVGSAPIDNPQNTTYSMKICTTNGPNCAFVGTAGQTFTATADQPWLTLNPSSGTVPASGITLTVTALASGLGTGTNTGSVTVAFGGGALSQGRVGPNGGTPTTSTSNVSVNLVAPVANTPKNTPPPDALIIPAVAHANGISSHFESDIRVSNTSPQPMKYLLTFTPSGDSGIREGKQTTLDIDPGRTVALDDVLNGWFGAGAQGQSATGALEIRPLTSTATSVSSSAVSGLPNIVTFASSRTYSTAAKGSLGTFVPAIPFANFIGNKSTLTLQQVAQTSTFRTNLGLVEGSGQPATVLIKMFSASGQQLGSMTQQLTGGQHLQINQVLATKGLTNVADGRLEISVTSATGKVTAYASVLDNNTNDAQLVSPVSLASAGSAKYVLAGVADQTTDAGKEQSDVRLFNASSTPVTATLSLHVDGSSEVMSKNVTLGGGQVETLDNVVQTLFGKAGVGSAALHITTAQPANLIATAKTYTQLSSGSIGQFISAVTPAQAVTAASRPLQLLQVEESNRFSTDVGVAEVSGKPVQLEVSIIPQDAKVSAKVQVSLGANEFRTMKQLLKSAGLDGQYNARVTVKVIGGAGAATAYASVTDKVTNDKTFLPAQ